MSSNENNLDNSIESALNMSQDEIESLLNGYEQSNNEQFDFEGEDLASLLSELEAADDEDIQEISNLLEKAETNEAADEGIEELMRTQEEEGEIPEYATEDLFSNEDAAKAPKKGLIQRIIEKFKKPASKKKENKSEDLSETASDENEMNDFQPSEDDLNGSDAIIFELEKDEMAKQEQEELDKIKNTT